MARLSKRVVISTEEEAFLRQYHQVKTLLRGRQRYYYDGRYWTHPKGLPEAKRRKKIDREEYIDLPDDPDFELDDEPTKRRVRLKLKRH